MANVLLWLLGGVVTGWITWSFLNLGAANTAFVSAVITIVGLIFGGDALTPAIGGQRASGALTPFSVLLASAGGIGCLKVLSLVRHYFGTAGMARRAANKSV